MVEPCTFVRTMSKHWEERFQNVVSPELQETWRLLAVAFNERITSFGTADAQRWKAIPAPTGVGKSQGLAVYCSLLPRVEHPGVLIVVRLIRQADEIAETINRLTGRDEAVAYHGDNRVPVDTLSNYPVVVITHRAYEIGLDAVNQGREDASNWKHYLRWSLEGRKLVVIDEALDMIEEAQIDLERVKVVRAIIPEAVASRYPGPMAALTKLEEVLTDMARVARERKQNGYTAEHERMLWKGDEAMPPECDMTELRRELRSIRVDRLVLKRNDLNLNKRVVQHYDTVLRDAQTALSNWNWYAKKLQEHTINTARLIIPDEITGAVILDATANSDVVYQVFDHKVDVIQVPQHARSYANVRLHVSTGHAVGKTSLVRNAKEEASRLVENLTASLPSTRKVLVICHQWMEPHLIAYRDATNFAAFDVGHWGAIDGRNDWQHFDTVVIFGLPYRDKAWSANTFMAIRGRQSTQWLNSEDRPFKNYRDVRRALEVGKLIVGTVQGMNRVQCRRVIDADGNCAPTDVFLLLPGGDSGTDILEGIKREMPSIQVQPWEYHHSKGRLQRSNFEEALIRLASLMMAGRRSASEVRSELGVSSTHWERLVSAMKDPGSLLAQRLSQHGVRYHVEGSGRRLTAYLVKED